MNSDWSTQKYTNGKIVQLSNDEIKELKQKYNQFKSTFDMQQSEFLTSLESQYYLISIAYLKDWIDYATNSQPKRRQLRIMNDDLIDAGGQLRKGLVQKQDFQIINHKIYDLVKSSQGYQIKRNAVFVNNQKKVPIYLQVVKYLKLDHVDIRNIDSKKISSKQLRFKYIQFPLQDTVANLINQIKKAQKIEMNRKIKLWKNNDKDTTIQSIYSFIKQKTRLMMTMYRIQGIGKCIQSTQATLDDLNMENGDYFIVEVSDQFLSFFFKDPQLAKCQNCYKQKKLQIFCGCKAVAYCNSQCQEKDKRFHQKVCKYAQQQQLNQQLQMIITSNSSLGRVGLSNLGNTCFMNSCLQCLSNTTLLTQYIINRYYQKQVNKDNPLGSQGKLIKNYAKFIKNMWCSSQSIYSPYNLKSAVAKLNPIFSGYAQHDSQQFFSYLADGIHQDLNRIRKKPYVQSIDSKNRPDSVVALESWIAHTQRNQSIIVDLMTGQYKSKVICPTCNLQSITFDPFTTISLPIPQQATPGILKYYIIYQNNDTQNHRMSFQYTKADCRQWLQSATKLLKRQPEEFLFYILTVFQNVYGFHSTSKAQILHKIQAESKNVFLLQLSPEQRSIKQRLEIVTKLCQKSSSYSNQFTNLWFKRPFFFQKKTTTVMNVYERMIKFLYKIYIGNQKISYEQYFKKITKDRPFQLVLKYKKVIQRSYSRVQTQFKKQIRLNKDQYKLIDIIQEIETNDYELDVRFTRDTAKMFQFQKLKSYNDIGQKPQLRKKSNKQQVTVSLDQCFKVFEQKQTLDLGNQWYCPKCKQHKQATKQMSIYKSPQILILHLKRFKNKGIILKQKNQTNVDFPVVLDLNQYVIDPTPMSTYVEYLRKQNKYVQPVYKAQYNTKSLPQYQLYAISNHYGGLGGGHYTAFAKNKDKWLQFNDSSVRSANQQSIKGSAAYMLFYRRKNSMKFI